MIEVMALAQQCAPYVAPETVVAIARVESSFNPYAIGVVGGALKRQPTTKAEALAAVRELERQGRNFSVGITQVNRYNLPKYGLTYEQAFEPCQNIKVGGKILQECYARAMPTHGHPQRALRAAFSCYYSGNFIRGFRPDSPGQPSYVQKVVAAALNRQPATLRVPRVEADGDGTQLVAPRKAPKAAASTSVRSVLLNAAQQAGASPLPPTSAEIAPLDAPSQPRVVPATPEPVTPVSKSALSAPPEPVKAAPSKVVF